MLTLPEWVATAATITGAVMVAANLGARVTGWGFVIFTVGSVAWVTTGVLNDQTSLIVTNAVLFLVNLFGVWRWLGRQSRYEDSSTQAAARSRRAPVPSLFPAGTLVGAKVKAPDGKSRGEIVEAMLERDGKDLAYAVVSEGGIGGAGEVLRVLAPEQLRLEDEDVYCDLRDAEWSALPTIEHDRWPTSVKGDAPR